MVRALRVFSLLALLGPAAMFALGLVGFIASPKAGTLEEMRFGAFQAGVLLLLPPLIIAVDDMARRGRAWSRIALGLLVLAVLAEARASENAVDRTTQPAFVPHDTVGLVLSALVPVLTLMYAELVARASHRPIQPAGG
jgi:hypothetical protein